ncbi:MAG TPA: PAS domain S-box protein, partial [Blastocatellia bacterium]|nr:PAS domain S-box protein [Blastocatellia bacterium]
HPEDREQVVDRLMEGLRQGTILPPYQYRHKHKNGTWRVLESVGKRFIDETGRQLAIINSRDITERREAERRLEESEQRYRSLFEHNPDAVFSLDLYNRLLNVNQVGSRLTGYLTEELPGRLFEELFAAEDREKVASHTRDALKGQPQNFEATIIAKDRRRVATSVLNVPIVVNGDVIGLYSVVKDITEQRLKDERLKKSEEQLLQAQKMEAIGQLAGGVAHDFNNLLTAVAGYSDLLLKRLRTEDPLRHYAEEISKACARAASLTAQLLAFSRQQLLQPQVLNLNAIIADMSEMLPRLIGENIELRVLLDDELGSTKADAGQIEQVVLNLAVNARDAMPEGGKLTIETHNVYLDQDYIGSRLEITPGPYVKLSVSDTGCGMDEKVKKQIFEPFFTTKDVGKGTGLGLSTVYGIVKQSGGTISVYSEPGNGTTFNIYLPRVDEEAQESQRKIEVLEVPRGTETILLAEDDQAIRNLIREVLETNGYRVLEAANGVT